MTPRQTFMGSKYPSDQLLQGSTFDGEFKNFNNCKNFKKFCKFKLSNTLKMSKN